MMASKSPGVRQAVSFSFDGKTRFCTPASQMRTKLSSGLTHRSLAKTVTPNSFARKME